jgi:hypothetical protein
MLSDDNLTRPKARYSADEIKTEYAKFEEKFRLAQLAMFSLSERKQRNRATVEFLCCGACIFEHDLDFVIIARCTHDRKAGFYTFMSWQYAI